MRAAQKKALYKAAELAGWQRRWARTPEEEEQERKKHEEELLRYCLSPFNREVLRLLYKNENNDPYLKEAHKKEIEDLNKRFPDYIWSMSGVARRNWPSDRWRRALLRKRKAMV